MAQTLVGRYELEVPLGSGAMGEVWRGRDLATRQPVAVKLVQLEGIDDQARVAETITRFRREADTLARLRQPNIVAALAAGRVGNELFMVMELAEGISLSAMLRQRQANRIGLFPVESVLNLAVQACNGLAAAHAIGVVHRDIKPSNLMVSARGHLTIVDFGIARLLEDNSPRLTAQGETIGTLLYMSPEQAAGVDVDARSDLYSFGCVLYELLAGRPPFMADLPIALMQMHLRERPVPLRSIRIDLPNGLTELVDRLLEKNRDARPADAAYVARILAGIGGQLDDGGAPQHEADRRTFMAGQTAGRPGGGPGVGAPGPEAYRATMLAEDPRQRPSAPGGLGYRPTVGPGTTGAAGPGGYGDPFAAAPPADEAWFDQGPPGQRPGPADPGLPPWEPAGVPAPASGRRRKSGGRNGGKDKRRAGGGPDGWPTARPRPRRRRWAGALSTLLTFAIVAGVAAYVWHKTHATLKVTATAVSVNTAKISCNDKADVVATIFTNGQGGPITFQWTKDGENLPTGTVTATSGKPQVQVHLKWYLRGQGTHHAQAIFQVFTPNVISSQSATFTYTCAS